MNIHGKVMTIGQGVCRIILRETDSHTYDIPNARPKTATSLCLVNKQPKAKFKTIMWCLSKKRKC